MTHFAESSRPSESVTPDARLWIEILSTLQSSRISTPKSLHAEAIELLSSPIPPLTYAQTPRIPSVSPKT